MDVFNYIAAAVSVVIGLGLTYLLDDVSKLVQNRKRIRPYWVHSVWVLITILLHFQMWWGFWRFHEVSMWTFPVFFCYLVVPATLFVVADLLFPEMTPSTEMSLKNYYFDNRQWIFGALAVFLTLAAISSSVIVIDGRWLHPSNAARATGIGLAIVAASSKNETVHAVVCILVLLLLTVFLLLFNSEPLKL